MSQQVTIGRTTYTFVPGRDPEVGMILGDLYTPNGTWRGWVCEDPRTGNRNVLPPMSGPVGAERAALSTLNAELA